MRMYVRSLSTSITMERNEKSKRGFAAMNEDKQREIASMGGKAAHQRGTAHEFTSEEAKAAGRRGGRARHGQRDDTEEE